jgi:hypothetical protein
MEIERARLALLACRNTRAQRGEHLIHPNLVALLDLVGHAAEYERELDQLLPFQSPSGFATAPVPLNQQAMA